MSSTDGMSHARREARARMMRRRRITVITAVSVVALLAIAGIVWAVAAAQNSGASDGETASSQHADGGSGSAAADADESETQPAQRAQFDYDLDSPDSITVVVNKQRPLPADWQPADLVVPEGIDNNWGDALRAPAATALQELAAAAASDGVPFIIASGFRDYARQAALFDGYAESDGVDAAEAYSARPGFSEHQTGLAVDLTDGGECTLEECFGDTATGLWLRDHAWRYGFILRYEQGEQATVGYSYEPWHFRYVGVDVSTAMHEQGEVNLETFFGLPAAPGY